MLRNRKAPGCCSRQRSVVGGVVYLPGGNMVKRAEKAPGGYFFAVLKLKRTTCGIPGIGKRHFLLDLPFMVEPLKGVVGHEHFSADFKLLRNAFALEFDRDIGYPPGICGNVVSHDTVPACECPEQPAVPICKAYCSTVELQFTAVREIPTLESLGNPVGEFFHLSYAVGVCKREHWIAVLSLYESCADIAARTASGGVLRYEFRILSLKRFQLMHERVKLVVRHHRCILYIVKPAVLVQNGPELIYPRFCCILFHNLQI